MQQLLDDDNPRIKALAEARLGVKSSLLQTRSETLGWMATRGPLCVYLRMYGAHTTRWSGGDKSNFQNFKRNDPDYPTAAGGLNLRDAIRPPDGYMLVKSDLSQIECRLLNYVAGQADVIRRFGNNEDPYVNVASRFYGFEVNKKDHPVERQVGKVLELQAGYGSGAGTIARTLKRAGIELDDVQALAARDAYRDTHPAVVELWRSASRMISRLAGGPPCEWGPMHVRDHRIWLPNGCPLIYDTLEYHRDLDNGEEYWRLRTRHGWSKLYGAKLVENCLSAGTLVLTYKGWVPIICVARDDLVWDGVEWCAHSGLRLSGVEKTAALDGVRMTADHEVLTDHGWVRAAQAQGLHRAAVRLPNSYKGRRNDGAETPVADSLRLRQGIHNPQRPICPQPFMRLYEEQIDCASADTARDVKTSSLCGVAIHARSLQTFLASSVEKLWRAWNICLREMATKFRKLLGRYGTNIQVGPDLGSNQQQSGVFCEELPLDRLLHTGEESPRQSENKNPVGEDYREGSGALFGPWSNDAAVPSVDGVAEREVVYPSQFVEAAYDLLNCGPRRRFVVLGSEGPFIVHNCIQALARVVISRALIRVARLGYRIVNTEHDSLWVLVPEDGQERQHMRNIRQEMIRVPEWAPGLPLDCEISV